MSKKNQFRNSVSKKRQVIIDSALEVFLESGFGAATIDAVVARAGGSKATIYKHFKNKEELFSVVVDKLVQQHPVDALDSATPPKIALLHYAKSRLGVVFTKKHSALRRLIIGEGARFPQIAQTYLNHGPGWSHKILTDYFKHQNVRAGLAIKDPELVADIFQSMLMHPLYMQSLYAANKQISVKTQTAHAVKIVDEFMRLYEIR